MTLIFSKLFKDKGTIEEVVETFDDCSIDLISMNNYIYTLSRMMGFYETEYKYLKNNINDHMHEYRKYTEFYFYMEAGVNLFEDVLDFLSRVTQYISKVEDNTIKVLFKINGDDLNKIHDADRTNTKVYSKFNNSIIIIDSIYFDNPRDYNLLDTDLDYVGNMIDYEYTICNFKECINCDNDNLVIEPDNKVIADNRLREVFGYYNLVNFISPPLYKINDEYILYNNIKDLLKEVSYAGYALDLMKYYKDLYTYIHLDRVEATSKILEEIADCDEIIE